MVWFSYRMRLTVIVLTFIVAHANTKQPPTTTENEKQEKTSLSKGSPLKGLPKNAIIAIEVVDPNENSTKDGKGRKRTIESALGYGYNGGYENFFNVKTKPPKYEVYKYSQHDIPAYKGAVKNTPAATYTNTYQSYNHGSAENSPQDPASISYTQQITHGGGHGHGHGHDQGEKGFDIQKSVQYDIGSTNPVYEHTPQGKQEDLQQYYQHGATLFSSVDNNGHLSSLSSRVPTNHGPMVPVIILRVYTNQLGQNSLHANIPEGHPYANLNSIDLQSLLAGYVQSNPHQETQQYYHEQVHQAQSQHQPHIQSQEQAYYQHPDQYNNGHVAQSQHNVIQSHQDAGLPTNENYPDDAHTKVIFKKPSKSRSKVRTRPPQKFKITIPENTYSKVEVQEHTYGGPHDGGQYVQQHVQYAQPQEAQNQQQYEQYYYQQVQYQQNQQPQQQQQHSPQQEYQSSVVQYQQIGPKGVYVQPVQQHNVQEDQYSHQGNQPQVQEQQQEYQQYDAKQYVQLATYPNQPDPAQGHSSQQVPQNQEEYYNQYLQYLQQQHQQQQHQQQHQQQQHQQQQVSDIQVGQNHNYQKPTGTEVQYLQRTPEQGTENQDYAIVKHSNDAGRDLHPKLYNYHAHESPSQQGAPKKKRERKQRRSRVPLVLAPEVMETIDKKQ